MILNVPVSSVSFGQIGYNILRECYKRKLDVAVFPLHDYDFSPFNPDPRFVEWIQNSINQRYRFIGGDIPSFRLWHLAGSETVLNGRQILLTFQETDVLTGPEKNISSLQERVLLTNHYSVQNFHKNGVDNADFIPLGLDPDILDYKFSRKADYLHWVLVGKLEKRKHTLDLISAWCEKYGNNLSHRLTLCVYNPFMNEQQNSAVLQRAFVRDGEIKKPSNVNVLPRLPLNSQMAELYHSADIDLGGMSGGEGLNLPSLTMTALGKWSIVLNAHAHKTWADKGNAILVEPNGKMPATDGVFFHDGDLENSFNQGNFYTYDKDNLIRAFERAEALGETQNKNGLKLRDQFGYGNCVDKIIEVCHESKC